MRVCTDCVLANHDAAHCCENIEQGVGLKIYLEERLDAFDLFSFFLPSSA